MNCLECNQAIDTDLKVYDNEVVEHYNGRLWQHHMDLYHNDYQILKRAESIKWHREEQAARIKKAEQEAEEREDKQLAGLPHSNKIHPDTTQ